MRSSCGGCRIVRSKVIMLWAVRMERFWAVTVQVERPCGVAVTTLPSPSAHLVSTCFLRLLAPPLTAAGVTWGPLLRHVRMAAGSVTAH